MEYEFVETQKGSRALLTKGYRQYLRTRAGKEETKFWRCSYKTYLAKATTNDTCHVSLRGEHNHAPNPSKNKGIAKMRKRTREEVSTVSTIYNDKIAMDLDREAIMHSSLPTLPVVSCSSKS